MSVTSVAKDTENLTMTVTAAYDVPVERAWQLWADPRQLERWWGPPTYPATFVDHDLSLGGRTSYYMTGPEGDRHHGWWEVTEVAAPHRLVILDGFSDANGKPDPAMPTMTMTIELAPQNEGDANGATVVTILTRFPSLEAMGQLLAMGMEEGLRAAMGQIDDVLGVPAAG